MTIDPLVSVVMPVRNGMPYLPEAIDSIRCQTWKPWELLVVDDGSSDGTAAYLSSLDRSAIRLFRTTGVGVYPASEVGIRAARGELIALMDADDISSPTRLEAQVSFLLHNPQTVAVGTQIRFLIDRNSIPAFRLPRCPNDILDVLRRGRVALCNCSVMMRTFAARRICPKVHGPGYDFDFYLRLAADGELANLDDVLVNVRISKRSMSFCHIDEQLCGIAFATAADRARIRGTPEPDFTAFQEAWNSRPTYRRFATRLRVLHQQSFRNALIHRAHGDHFTATLAMSASALLYPPAAWHHIQRVARLGTRHIPLFSQN